jgi:hypothetical protein
MNTAMYFFGIQNIMFGQIKIRPYDLFVAGIALLLTGFFLNTALREARKLAVLGE